MNRLRGIALALLVLAACTATWQVQNWRHEQRAALRAQQFAEERQQQDQAATAFLQGERQQRLALERRLQLLDQAHSRELFDVQQDQSRLRDRLATADLRLSVLLAGDAAADVPAASGAGGVVHGPARARLDPAHAQRIVAIVTDADQGLIALRACQAYVRALTL